MPISNYKDGGFTLIEILIVIMIIGLLSVFSVSGYSTYRRTALLELNSENLVAQIYQLRDLVAFGSYGNERGNLVRDALDGGGDLLDESVDGAKCYGVVFTKVLEDVRRGDGEIDLKFFSEDFNNTKVLKNGDFVYEGCVSDGRVTLNDFEIAKDIVVRELFLRAKSGTDVDVNDIFVMKFLPPNGDVEFVFGNDVNRRNMKSNYSGFGFIVSYAGNNDNRFEKEIFFDFNSNKFLINDVALEEKK